MPELLMAIVLILPLSAGVMLTIVNCMGYARTAANYRVALAAAQQRMTDVENSPFAQILANFHRVPFQANGIDGRGLTYVITLSADHLLVVTEFSWKDASGRVYGEDLNLNGVRDLGEDVNDNGILDSIVEFTTSRYNY